MPVITIPGDDGLTNAFELAGDHSYRLLDNGGYFVLYDLTARSQITLADALFRHVAEHGH